MKQNPATALFSDRDTGTGRFLETKRTGGSFAGVVIEDGRWHRWSGLRLACTSSVRGTTVRRVGLVRWLLRWGGKP